MTRFAELLKTLAGGGVEFIVVGGVAAAARGSARATQDLDIVYGRSEANLRAVVKSLGPYHCYPRGAPPGLPFRLDFETLRAGLNFTLVSDLGCIGLLGEVAGGGAYEDILPHSTEIRVFESSVRVADLEMLIRMKRAAGRPKDFETIAELERLREHR